MSRRASLLLRASVIWTAWIWVTLIRNMIISHDAWSFRLIHIGLGIVSIAFAVVTWRITSTSRRFTRAVERERNPPPARTPMARRAGATLRRNQRQAPPPDLSLPVSGSLPLDTTD